MLRTAKTENGSVRGLPGTDRRITVFKGIPFAQAPIGPNRWRAPKPAANWDGVRDCYTFGPISMQDTPGLGTDIYCREWHVDSKVPMSEDCLYLNVWTPANSTDEKLPVLVWFFGGGFQWGYTSEMEFEGERLARRGIVVVSVNYRLGAFGFLTHPEITKEAPDAPANFGLLDQRAGLMWTIKNIEQFGGDPSNITIAGQSAGGGSVMNHLVAKADKGLFQKAVIFSGVIRSPYFTDPFLSSKTISDTEKNGEAFFEFLGVKSLEEARALDAFYIRDKYGEFAQKNPRFAPVTDGVYITGDPYELIIRGKHNDVPVMAGNTGDEFFMGIPAKDEAELGTKAHEILGDFADSFLTFPEAHEKKGPFYAPLSMVECAAKSIMEANESKPGMKDCYYYRFTPDIPGDDNPGTFHSCDLWFWFETLAACNRAYVGRHYDLARQMCNYWTNFIKTGDPNGNDTDGTPMPLWKPYKGADRNEMEFTANGSAATVDTSAFKKAVISYMKDI